MPKEEKTELIEPKPDTLKAGEEEAVEKKEEAKPDPLAELEARLTARFEKEIKERDDKISALSKPVQQPGPTVVEKIDIYKDLGTKIWEDTPAALKSLRDEIKKEVTTELRGEYQSARSEEKFWDDFYRHNKTFDRAEDHWVVQAIVQENFASWKDLPVARVREELAKETEKRLARIEARKDRGGDPKGATLSLSSASAPSPRRETVPDAGPTSVSEWLRNRHKARNTSIAKRQEARTRDDQGRFRKELN